MTRIKFWVDGVLDGYVSHLPMLVLAKNMVYRIIPTLIYPVKHHDKVSGGWCTWGICFALTKTGSCIELVYRIIPTLIYLVKHHDKDSGGRCT